MDIDKDLHGSRLRVYVRAYCRGYRPRIQPKTIRYFPNGGLQLPVVYQAGPERIDH